MTECTDAELAAGLQTNPDDLDEFYRREEFSDLLLRRLSSSAIFSPSRRISARSGSFVANA